MVHSNRHSYSVWKPLATDGTIQYKRSDENAQTLVLVEELGLSTGQIR